MEHDFLEDAAQRVAAARSVAVLTGAGVSAESGVPTFRGADGMWRQRNAMDLATPEAFRRDPALVWEFYNERRDLLLEIEPNPAHVGLAELESPVGVMTVVTQNVDRLHQRAGSGRVLELHGNLDEVRCTGCARLFDRAGVRLPPLPTCEACGQLLRPNVVWFGESLDDRVWRQASRVVADAECVLVIGTSAVVYPAAGLITAAVRNTASVIEINLERTGASVSFGLYGKAGQIVPELVERVRLLKTSP